MSDRNWVSNTPFGVGLIVIFMLAIIGLINHEKYTNTAYETATQEYQQTKGIAPLGSASKGHYTDPKSYRDEWRSEQDLHAQRDMAFWAKYLLIATVIGVVLLGATLWETRKAAQAAEEVVTVTRHTAERQLRAYISVEPDGVSTFNPPTHVVARVKFHNVGAIFAKNVSTFVTHQLNTNGELTVESLPVDETKLSGNNVIAPTAELLYATEAISKGDIDKKKHSKTLYLYVWGMVRYHDGFTDGRWTKFCHRYNYKGIASGKYIIPAENYRYHQAGNEIDDMP